MQRLVRLRVVPLLLLVFRERLLLGRAVLLYLEHKVNNYSPIEQANFQEPKQIGAGLSLSLSLSLLFLKTLTLNTKEAREHNQGAACEQSRVIYRLKHLPTP